MAREDPQLKLRLTEEMKDRVAEAARESGRSVNAEIVARLERSFEGFYTQRELTVALVAMARFALDQGASTFDQFIEALEAKRSK